MKIDSRIKLQLIFIALLIMQEIIDDSTILSVHMELN